MSKTTCVIGFLTPPEEGSAIVALLWRLVIVIDQSFRSEMRECEE